MQDCPDCGIRLPMVRKPANWRQALWGGATCPRCGCEIDRFGRKVERGGGGSRASDAMGLTISHDKLKVLRPDLYGFQGLRQRYREATGLTWPQRSYLETHLREGDSRAAVVVSTDPLLVAAYTDELDCVAILEFPDEFVDDYGLKEGSRLLTINTYNRQPQYDADLVLGSNQTGRWTGFHPIIAEFVSDDEPAILARKRAIPAEEWQRTYRMGRAYLKQRPGLARDGRPVFASMAADRDEEEED